ncbi:MAG: UDP-3-O-(3-hydroxymyristoyl)glucosamine N-acyltransferase [Fimbriimonadaceae bacterium]|nr:UDP-3-O-(3-hydroxymyristoyl)glucosamine N-acyltransferase [Fimbriimonadaceae bacterium]QYK57988.1 MAG: UDP-3-O-(3-hydroxymyristoyl)glucosamine N-acyltransferase [Fimbriimonadaceae bacterium]
MAAEARVWTLGQIASLVDGKLHGPSDQPVSRPVPAGWDEPSGITFAEDEANLSKAQGSSVGAVLIGPGMVLGDRPHIVVSSPRAAFFRVLGAFETQPFLESGVHPTAVVAPEATVEPGASVGAFAVIEARAVVESGARVFAHCYVGQGSRIGARSVLMPGVVLYPNVVIGADCLLHSGVVLGCDGFGFFWDGSRQMKIPHAGHLRVGDMCEFGANTCIDRATCGDSIVGEGVKLDNLVHIGHNARIGAHTVMAGQVGVSGSVTLGERCVIGGQSGITDHVTVAGGTRVGGMSGVSNDVPDAKELFGIPARPLAESMRSLAALRKLPELFKRVMALESQIKRTQD